MCYKIVFINPVNAELYPICHLLALLGAHHIFHFSGLRVNLEASENCHSRNIFMTMRCIS
jgi:hypothetical protein